MTRDYQSRTLVPANRVRSERVVAGHVSMHNLNLMLAHQFRQRAGAECVERVSQRQIGNLGLGQALAAGRLKRSNQGRVWPRRYMNFMSAFEQPVDEVDKVALAAAESLR